MHRIDMLRSLSFALSLATLAALSGCTTGDGPAPDDAGTDAPPADAGPADAGFACVPDAPGCFGYVHYTCGADGVSREDEVECEGGCDPALGCVECTPGAFRCDDHVSMRCDEDHRFVPLRDCEEWGVACGASGFCDDACGLAEAVRSNVGCEYFPVPLANIGELDQRAYDFRVVVANPSAETATVTILRGARLVAQSTVTPGGVAEIPLPWIDGQSFAFDANDWGSVVTADGAYRLMSSRPVIVSQFNPFHYASARADFAYTNDASLLLPAHALGRDHVAVTYPPFSRSSGGTDVAERSSARFPDYVAVIGVAAEPTLVEVVVAADVAADMAAEPRWPRTPRGGTIRFTVARGEVAQIAAAVPPPCDADRPGFRDLDPDPDYVHAFCREEGFDLTGSRITSDRPVAVLGAHTCANVPYHVAACDHLETQLAPVDTWGTRFETTPLRDPGTSAPNLVRIVAAHDGTVVTVSPPIDRQSEIALDEGGHVELEITEPVSIRASRPIQVAQLMVGQHIEDPPLERGDPSLTVLVPEEQFRRDYVFVTPSSYAPSGGGQSYLLVSREPGDPVVLDEHVLEAIFARVGDRELAIVPVSGGTHRLTAGAPVGLIAYGMGLYTSYAYPAGLDLRILPI